MVCLTGSGEAQSCNTCTVQQTTELQMPQHRPLPEPVPVVEMDKDT